MKKKYDGLKAFKVSFGDADIMTKSSCQLMVAFNDNNHNGLCDEAEEDPVNGNFMEWYISPGP